MAWPKSCLILKKQQKNKLTKSLTDYNYLLKPCQALFTLLLNS